MGMLCAVSFTRHGKLYYLDPGPYEPRVGDKVLVPTDSGDEVAECVWAPQWVSEDTPAPLVQGMARPADLEATEHSRRRRAAAKVASKQLIAEHDLPMKVVAVDHIRDDHTQGSAGRGEKVTLYFTAPHRIDFRALVRDLGATLGCRVELRQLSARDAARAQPGIGPCGRDTCCSTFLKDFEPVSVRMARDQGLPPNPMRISGACGKLMCCLKYEHPLYEGFRAKAPAVGEKVDSPQGPGRVVGHDVPREEVVVRLDDGGSRCSCALASVCGSRQAFEGSPSAGGPVGG